MMIDSASLFFTFIKNKILSEIHYAFLWTVPLVTRIPVLIKTGLSALYINPTKITETTALTNVVAVLHFAEGLPSPVAVPGYIVCKNIPQADLPQH